MRSGIAGEDAGFVGAFLGTFCDKLFATIVKTIVFCGLGFLTQAHAERRSTLRTPRYRGLELRTSYLPTTRETGPCPARGRHAIPGVGLAERMAHSLTHDSHHCILCHWRRCASRGIVLKTSGTSEPMEAGGMGIHLMFAVLTACAADAV